MQEHNPPRRAEMHQEISVSSPDGHLSLHRLNPRPQQNYKIQWDERNKDLENEMGKKKTKPKQFIMLQTANAGPSDGMTAG